MSHKPKEGALHWCGACRDFVWGKVKRNNKIVCPRCSHRLGTYENRGR